MKKLLLLFVAFATMTLSAQVMTNVDFEDGTFGTWTLVQVNTAQTFVVANVAAGNGNTTTKSAQCAYDPALVLQDEQIISPVLDFTNVTAADMQFTYMMSYHWGHTPNNNYDLNVLVSTDGGTTWTEIWDEHMDTNFASTANNYEYMPTVTLDLSSYAGQATVQISLQYLGTDGAQGAFDEVVITDNTSASIEDLAAVGFTYQPNPVIDVLTMNAKKNISNINMFNILGQSVLQISPNSLESKLDISHLPAGAYFIQAQVGNNKGTFKIIKN